MLAKIISQRHGFKTTVLFSLAEDGTIDPNKPKSLSAPAELDKADGIVILTRFRQWPEADLQHFVDAVNRGVPIIGLRTATHALSGDAQKPFGDFGEKVLGENWVNHWGKHKIEGTKAIIEEPSAKDRSDAERRQRAFLVSRTCMKPIRPPMPKSSCAAKARGPHPGCPAPPEYRAPAQH